MLNGPKDERAIIQTGKQGLFFHSRSSHARSHRQRERRARKER